MAVQLILKNSSIEDKRPTAAQLANGELSINYNEAGPFIACKDTAGNIQSLGGVKFADDAPGDPPAGAWWYNTAATALFVFDGTTWQSVGGGGGGGGGGISAIIGGEGIDATYSGSTVTLDVDLAGGNDGLEFDGGQIKATTASKSAFGSVSIGDNVDVSAAGQISIALATESVLGVVKVGSGIDVAIDGTISVDIPQTLNYRGSCILANSPTGQLDPSTPVKGDAYINSADTSAINAGWTGLSGSASAGDLVVWDGSEWELIGTGGTEYWARNSVTGTLSPENDGDSLSIGLGNIELNADGSGEFVGNVGIGITPGAAPLHVAKSSGEALRISATGVSQQISATFVGGLPNEAELKIGVNSSGGGQGGFIRQVNNAPIDFFTNDTQRMRLNNVGSVLIGGTLPSDPAISLSANGSIYAAGDVLIGGLPAAPKITLAASGLITSEVGAELNTGKYANRGALVGAIGEQGGIYYLGGNLGITSPLTTKEIQFATAINGDVKARIKSSNGDFSTDGSITAAGLKFSVDINGVVTTDGSITAEGNIQAGGNPNSGVATGTQLTTTAGCWASAAVGTTSVFRGYTTGTGDPTIRINASGSITTAGEVRSGGNPASGANAGCRLNTNQGVEACGNIASATVFKGFLQGTSSPTYTVKADGKITAADRINVGANAGTSTSDTAGAALYGLDGSITAYKKSTDVSPFFTGTKYADSVGDRFKFIVHNDGELVINPVSNTKGVPAAITLAADGTITATGNVDVNDISTASGSRLYDTGGIYTRYDGTDSEASVFKSYKNGFNDASNFIDIKATGAARFAGEVNGSSFKSVNKLDSNTFVSLTGAAFSTGGTAPYGGSLYIRMGGSSLSTTANVLLNVRNDANNIFAVRGDGTVVVGGTPVGTGTQVPNISLAANGTISAVNTTIQPISSERRLKENIVAIDADAAWETVKSTPYYAYNFIGSESTTYGPMADEVPAEMVVQPMVEDEDGVKVARADAEGPIRTYDNGMLQARLYTALQSALTRIEELEARLAAAGM